MDITIAVKAVYDNQFENGISLTRENGTFEAVLTHLPDGEELFTLAAIPALDNPNHEPSFELELDPRQVQALRDWLNSSAITAYLENASQSMVLVPPRPLAKS